MEIAGRGPRPASFWLPARKPGFCDTTPWSGRTLGFFMPGNVYLLRFQTVRPGSFSRTAQSVPPAVTKRVLKSSPPKAQLVHSSRGIGIVWRSSPLGEKT